MRESKEKKPPVQNKLTNLLRNKKILTSSFLSKVAWGRRKERKTPFHTGYRVRLSPPASFIHLFFIFAKRAFFVQFIKDSCLTENGQLCDTTK